MASTAACPPCHGLADPSEECVVAGGDPRPKDFATRGTRRCVCGRAYDTYTAGRSVRFVMASPQRRQVERCVRCGRDLAATQRAVARGGVQLEIIEEPAAQPRLGDGRRRRTRSVEDQP